MPANPNGTRNEKLSKIFENQKLLLKIKRKKYLEIKNSSQKSNGQDKNQNKYSF